jgi:Predicted carbamoyl transferase, NodU family
VRQKNYIGLACTGHDNALAIVNSSGKIVFAESTERFLQNKRAISAVPDDLIRVGRLINEYCDPDAQLVVAKTWSEKAVPLLRREHDEIGKYLELLKRRQQTPAMEFMQLRLYDYLHTLRFFTTLVEEAGTHLEYIARTGLGLSSPREIETRRYDHHLTHAAAACFTSPFEEAACAVVDGFGEGTSCSFFHYKDATISEIRHSVGNMKWSLGSFYVTLTTLCGFVHWQGEEWKVMGLASYGQFDPTIYELMQHLITIDGLDIVSPSDSVPALMELQKYARKPGQSALEVADLAYTGQKVFSEWMRELLQNLYVETNCRNLVLSGGCALNSSWNGQILNQTSFDSLHVFSAPADDGNAVGAALIAYLEDNPGARFERAIHSPYLGSAMSKETVDNLTRLSRISRLEVIGETVPKRAAELLAQGKIIGWVQGRAEFGPRALGNRSILADPRPAHMKEKINATVKFREEFRPFAPSVLHEHGDEFFCHYQESPYMERTLTFREEVRERVPAVVHVDGTGRLQTVREEWNPRYYQLISEFFKLTGVPLILNTSFNIMGKPIIHSVEDAISVFYTTGLDALVIEDILIEK